VFENPPTQPYPLTGRIVKCDGGKPACSACLDRQRPCSYRLPEGVEVLKRKRLELEKSAQSFNQVLEFLRVAPPDAAAALLHHLRSCGSVAEMVESTQSRVLVAMAASPSSAARDILLPKPSTVDSDLSLRYSHAFPQLRPGVFDLDLRLLGLGTQQSGPPPPLRPTKRRRLLVGTENGPTPVGDGPAAGLLLPATTRGVDAYADPRLSLLDLQYWTAVPIPKTLAAQAISFYLVNEHPVLCFFDPDLLVRDLVSGGKAFCSPLLVSALLAWACVCPCCLALVGRAASYNAG